MQVLAEVNQNVLFLFLDESGVHILNQEGKCFKWSSKPCKVTIVLYS